MKIDNNELCLFTPEEEDAMSIAKEILKTGDDAAFNVKDLARFGPVIDIKDYNAKHFRAHYNFVNCFNF